MKGIHYEQAANHREHYIADTFCRNAEEISDALDMLSYSLDELLNSANDELEGAQEQGI